MEEHVFLKQHYTKDDIARAVKVDVQTLYLKRIYFSSFKCKTPIKYKRMREWGRNSLTKSYFKGSVLQAWRLTSIK